MKILPIRIFPDPVLRAECDLVTRFDAALSTFVNTLWNTMKQQPGGIGIAAPQIGISKQIAIVDLTKKQTATSPIFMINPKILASAVSRNCVVREGCMSLPDFTANVIRSETVTIEYLNLAGETIRHHAVGLEAICVQHEIDHLNGQLFVDRVSSLKGDVFRRKRYLKE